MAPIDAMSRHGKDKISRECRTDFILSRDDTVRYKGVAQTKYYRFIMCSNFEGGVLSLFEVMNNPALYHAAKTVLSQVNTVYLPKMLGLMSWDFRQGNIMDYGSGPGNWGYQYLLPKAEETDSQLHFVDISPVMVEYSQKNFAHPRISHMVGNIPENFSLSPDYDRVVSVNVLHLIREIDPVLAGIKGVLKPGGQFGCTSTTMNNVVFRSFLHLINSPEWGPYMKGLEEYLSEWTLVPKGEDGTEYFRKVFVERPGFKEVFLLFEETRYEMTMDQYVDFSLSVNPLVKAVPTELMGKLKEEHISFVTFDLKISGDSKVVKFPFEYICFVLQK